jgi:predicted nucleotidyltransferase
MISKSIQKIIIKQLNNEIKDIELIILFGSATNGDYIQYKSDIDIAFLSSSTVSNLQRWGTQEKLASLLNSDIDLVNLHSSDDVFRFEIASKGKNLFIKPSSKIEHFLDSIYINYIQLNEDRAEVMQAFQ